MNNINPFEHKRSAMKDEYNIQKQMAQRIVELEAEVNKYRVVIDRLCDSANTELESIEALFKLSHDRFDYETLADYCNLARFMYGYRQRPHIADDVEKRMREMKISRS